MKLRIFSDLHLDLNSSSTIWFDEKAKADETMTLIAGDISGSIENSKKWLEKNVKNAIVVAGNHVVYNYDGLDIGQIKKRLATWFPVSGKISFLDEAVGCIRKDLSKNLAVIGSTLYIDGKIQDDFFTDDLYTRLENQTIVKNGINDFYFGQVMDENTCRKRQLAVKDYYDWFDRTIQRFENELSENESLETPKDFIVLTHFCPSPAFVVEEYSCSPLNPAFISDLEQRFIEKHPSIKAWVCGHVHSRHNHVYNRKDGSKCLFVANPRGYERAGETDDWSPNVFLDTEKWTVEGLTSQP